jgi:DNA-binding MarR family transcriptional regulator
MLFGEPAWDMLLYLFIERSEGRPVTVKAACVSSTAPQSTGLRWLNILESEGLVVSSNDTDDHRCRIIKLSDKGFEIMDDLLCQPELWG